MIICEIGCNNAPNNNGTRLKACVPNLREVDIMKKAPYNRISSKYPAIKTALEHLLEKTTISARVIGDIEEIIKRQITPDDLERVPEDSLRIEASASCEEFPVHFPEYFRVSRTLKEIVIIVAENGAAEVCAGLNSKYYYSEFDEEDNDASAEEGYCLKEALEEIGCFKYIIWASMVRDSLVECDFVGDPRDVTVTNRRFKVEVLMPEK